MRYLLKSSIQLIVIFLLFFIVSGCRVELLTTTAIQGELQAKQLKSMQRQFASPELTLQISFYCHTLRICPQRKSQRSTRRTSMK